MLWICIKLKVCHVTLLTDRMSLAGVQHIPVLGILKDEACPILLLLYDVSCKVGVRILQWKKVNILAKL